MMRCGSVTITIVSCNAPASRQGSCCSKRDQQQVMNGSHDEPPQSAFVWHGEPQLQRQKPRRCGGRAAPSGRTPSAGVTGVSLSSRASGATAAAAAATPAPGSATKRRRFGCRGGFGHGGRGCLVVHRRGTRGRLGAQRDHKQRGCRGGGECRHGRGRTNHVKPPFSIGMVALNDDHSDSLRTRWSFDRVNGSAAMEVVSNAPIDGSARSRILGRRGAGATLPRIHRNSTPRNQARARRK